MAEGPQFFAAGKLRREPFRAPPRGRRGLAQPSKTDLTSSPLSTIFPTTKNFGPVGFQAIKIPQAFQTAANLANSNNASGILYHCLCDVELATIFGECSIYGAILHLNSGPKATSVDRPNEVLWGIPPQSTTIVNTSIFATNRALIAIGDDKALPRGSDANNRWSFAPAGSLAVPGFNDCNASVNVNSEFVDSAGPGFIHYEYFPVGSYWLSTCQRVTLRPLFSPYVTRFPRGKRLRVSLIITNDNVTTSAEAGNDLFVYGGAAISLLIGEMQTQTPYTADE